MVHFGEYNSKCRFLGFDGVPDFSFSRACVVADDSFEDQSRHLRATRSGHIPPVALHSTETALASDDPARVVPKVGVRVWGRQHERLAIAASHTRRRSECHPRWEFLIWKVEQLFGGFGYVEFFLEMTVFFTTSLIPTGWIPLRGHY